MSLKPAARIARREMRGGLRGFGVFLACLALGVAAIAAVGSVREGIRAGLAEQGAVLLGGDGEVELTYRFASEQERVWLGTHARAVSEIAEFRSMAVTGHGENARRGLTQVKAVDDAWPLLGAPVLDPVQSLDEALAGQGGLPGIVMDRLLIDRLELKPGDEVRLGEQAFILTAALISEPDNATAGFGLGPRSLVRRADLARSGLLETGTLFNAKLRIILPEGADLEATKTAALQAIEGARWRDARDAAPGTRRFVERIAAFLVLVGLAGLAVGGVGVSAAVRAYLEEKTATIAVLKSLGAGRRLIFQIYFIQIAALSLLGIVLGLLLGAALPLLAGPLIATSLPVPADFSLHLAPLGEAALYGALSALVFTLWPLARTENVRAGALFRAADLGRWHWPRLPYLLATLSLLAGLIGAAVLFSDSAKLTLWAAGGFLVVFLVLIGAGRALGWLSRRLARGMRARPALRMALASVGGPGGETQAVVLSLGLGLSVLAAIGQIDSNLRGAIARELPEVAPSFFVVDILPDQIEAVKARLEGDPAVSRYDSAPMLRGVITTINGRPAREVTDHWVVRGDRGLTYSRDLPARTRLTAGEWWAPDYTGPPLISFAAEEASEIGLVLGDTLTINILGRDITGTIASFREVDFSGAGMGFVLSMNPAALKGAPHSFIATIYAQREAEGAILRDLSDAHPNVTVISVRSAITRVADLLGAIAAGITWGALATLVTGFVVLVGSAAAGQRARNYEAALLKTLGASRARVLANFALRSVLMGTAAGLVAVAAGGTGAWAVMHFVMEQDFHLAPVSALAIVLGGIAITLLAGLGFAWRALSVAPARVLRARE